MNLHSIVAGVISAVNPYTPVSIQASNGYTSASSAKRTPKYKYPFPASGQVQPMTYKDLMQVEGLNLNGTKRSMYLRGAFNGVVRSQIKGGDLVTIASGVNAGTWLVGLVLEQWPDWCKVAVTLQNP